MVVVEAWKLRPKNDYIIFEIATKRKLIRVLTFEKLAAIS